jgi:hypothetical protein
MAGLDPATQRAKGAKKDSRGDAEKKKNSASPREIFFSLADARLLDGRVKPGHGEWERATIVQPLPRTARYLAQKRAATDFTRAQRKTAPDRSRAVFLS